MSETMREPTRTELVRVVAAASAGSFVNLATTLLYTFGVFVTPIIAATGWSEPAVAGAVGPAFLVTIVTLPLVGYAVARFPSRALSCVSLLLLGIGAIMVGLVPRSSAQFGWVLAGAVLIGSGASPTLYSSIVSRVFDRRRGLALGVVTAFTGVGIAVLPPLAAFVIGKFDWRGAYVTLGLVALALAIIVPILLPKIPQLATTTGRANAGGLPGASLGEALRMPVFWVTALLFLLLSLVANGVPIQLPVILADRGLTPQAAAFGMSVMGIMVIIGRVVVGYLLDRLAPGHVLAVMLAGPLAACALLLWSGTPLSGMLAAGGLGLAVGGEFVGLAWMVSRAFGLRNFGLIYGWLAVAIAVGTSLGPIIIARLHSATGSFEAPLLVMLGAAALAIATALTLRRSQFKYAPGAATVSAPSATPVPFPTKAP